MIGQMEKWKKKGMYKYKNIEIRNYRNIDFKKKE